MKSIINGKRYDTTKAILIGRADSLGHGADSVNSFSFWSAGLYRTPQSKQYFLAGEGGAMTRWAKRVDGNSFTGGEGVVPLSREEAFEWAENFLDPALVEREFSDMIEDA